MGWVEHCDGGNNGDGSDDWNGDSDFINIYQSCDSLNAWAEMRILVTLPVTSDVDAHDLVDNGSLEGG